MLRGMTQNCVRRRYVTVNGLDQMVSTTQLVAFEALFREHYTAIVRAAYRVAGCQSAAEDIATEAFTKLFRDRAQIDNPVGWLKRRAIRGGLDYLRSAERRSRREEVSDVRGTANDSPEKALERTEKRQRVRHIFAEMPIREVEMLLARADGASHQEIATELGLHPPSVGSMIARAVDQFNRRYEDRYGTR